MTNAHMATDGNVMVVNETVRTIKTDQEEQAAARILLSGMQEILACLENAKQALERMSAVVQNNME